MNKRKRHIGHCLGPRGEHEVYLNRTRQIICGISSKGVAFGRNNFITTEEFIELTQMVIEEIDGPYNSGDTPRPDGLVVACSKCDRGYDIDTFGSQCSCGGLISWDFPGYRRAGHE